MPNRRIKKTSEKSEGGWFYRMGGFELFEDGLCYQNRRFLKNKYPEDEKRFCEPVYNALWYGHHFDMVKIHEDPIKNQYYNFLRHLSAYGAYNGLEIEYIDKILEINNPEDEFFRRKTVDLIYGLAKNVGKINHEIWTNSDIQIQIRDFFHGPKLNALSQRILFDVQEALETAFKYHREPRDCGGEEIDY